MKRPQIRSRILRFYRHPEHSCTRLVESSAVCCAWQDVVYVTVQRSVKRILSSVVPRSLGPHLIRTTLTVVDPLSINSVRIRSRYDSFDGPKTDRFLHFQRAVTCYVSRSRREENVGFLSTNTFHRDLTSVRNRFFIYGLCVFFSRLSVDREPAADHHHVDSQVAGGLPARRPSADHANGPNKGLGRLTGRRQSPGTIRSSSSGQTKGLRYLFF